MLCEEGSAIFDNLETLESSLSDATKMILLYIAGYIVCLSKQLFIVKSLENILSYLIVEV